MFNLNDVWNVINFLQGNNPSGLDPALQITSQSEKIKATTLFTETIDQIAFDSDDYQRLRNFLIDWYATFRTFTSIQQQTSDPYALTSDQLNELMMSFGYSYGLDILSPQNRINFFLDLVNLYKIKGSPLCIQRALGYYGLHNIDIAEYWLMKNSSGELVFRGEPTYPEINLFAWSDLDFDLTIARDPHWLATKSQILNSSHDNPIAFPSKSPYFGIRSTIDMNQLEVLMSWLSKVLYDQYQNFKITGILKQDILLSKINVKVSLLECYLSCAYIFNLSLNTIDSTSSDPTITFYNGNSLDSISALNEYNSIAFPRPLNQLDRDTRVQELSNLFSKSNVYDFIPEEVDIAKLLDDINVITQNNLKLSLDIWLSSSRQVDLLASLLQNLSGWLRLNTNEIFPEIVSHIIGTGTYIDINKILKMFKPYRSRVISTQYAYTFNNPVRNYFSIYDNEQSFTLKPMELIIDFATANSFPCIIPEVRVTSITPQNKEENVSVDSQIQFEFNVGMDETTFNSDGIMVSKYIGDSAPDFPNIDYSSDYLNSVTHLDVDSYLDVNAYLDGVNLDGTLNSYHLRYSRDTFDCGSNFDIGIVVDKEDFVITEEDFIYEKLNYHDGTSFVETTYTEDSTGNIDYILQVGLNSFDSNMIFDMPFISDITKIYVSGEGGIWDLERIGMIGEWILERIVKSGGRGLDRWRPFVATTTTTTILEETTTTTTEAPTTTTTTAAPAFKTQAAAYKDGRIIAMNTGLGISENNGKYLYTDDGGENWVSNNMAPVKLSTLYATSYSFISMPGANAISKDNGYTWSGITIPNDGSNILEQNSYFGSFGSIDYFAALTGSSSGSRNLISYSYKVFSTLTNRLPSLLDTGSQYAVRGMAIEPDDSNFVMGLVKPYGNATAYYFYSNDAGASFNLGSFPVDDAQMFISIYASEGKFIAIYANYLDTNFSNPYTLVTSTTTPNGPWTQGTAFPGIVGNFTGNFDNVIWFPSVSLYYTTNSKFIWSSPDALTWTQVYNSGSTKLYSGVVDTTHNIIMYQYNTDGSQVLIGTIVDEVVVWNLVTRVVTPDVLPEGIWTDITDSSYWGDFLTYSTNPLLGTWVDGAMESVATTADDYFTNEVYIQTNADAWVNLFPVRIRVTYTSIGDPSQMEIYMATDNNTVLSQVGLVSGQIYELDYWMVEGDTIISLDIYSDDNVPFTITKFEINEVSRLL